MITARSIQNAGIVFCEFGQESDAIFGKDRPEIGPPKLARSFPPSAST